MRVVIAEDLTLLREGLSRLLDDRGWEIVAAVDDGPKLVEAIVEHRPDIAIVDVRLPPSFTDEGIRAAIEARERVPGTPILILSQYVEESYASDLLAGAGGGVGYLLKDRVADIAHFVEAVRQVAERRSVLDPEVVAHMMGRRRRAHALDVLSERDREVLARMAEGASNVAIARRMFLSERAVERSVTAIFDKLGLAASRHAHRRVLAVLAYLRAAT